MKTHTCNVRFGKAGTHGCPEAYLLLSPVETLSSRFNRRPCPRKTDGLASTLTYTHTHTYTHTFLYIHSHTYRYTLSHTHSHKQTHTYSHSHNLHTLIYIFTYLHIHILSHTHSYFFTYIHTLTHTTFAVDLIASYSVLRYTEFLVFKKDAFENSFGIHFCSSFFQNYKKKNCRW